jgi:uncharacterized damage-inducible protein DinB
VYFGSILRMRRELMDIHLYRDLESYHAWAMRKLFALASIASPEILDAPHTMGMGSLRGTLQHIAAAERIWLDRWQGKPTAGLPEMPGELEPLSAAFSDMANERRAMLTSLTTDFALSISYRGLNGVPYENPLGELVMHVFNHAVHHRAQAVNLLKRHRIAIAGGLDYIFFRIARPTVAIDAGAAEGCRAWGLETGTELEPYIAPNKLSLARYSDYNDWGMHMIFDQILEMRDELLDRDHGIGRGTIRKSIQHLYDAECFWQACHRSPGSPFPNTPLTTSIAEFASLWATMQEAKRAWIERTDPSQFQNTIPVNFGSGALHFRFSEAMLQLSVHGTLHRAQITNMIRQSGITPRPLDYVAWLRST